MEVRERARARACAKGTNAIDFRKETGTGGGQSGGQNASQNGRLNDGITNERTGEREKKQRRRSAGCVCKRVAYKKLRNIFLILLYGRYFFYSYLTTTESKARMGARGGITDLTSMRCLFRCVLKSI